MRSWRDFFFFFSSRRRHTRCSRDWSSDVCSSDLDTALRDFVDRLQHAPDVIAKAEALKEEWLADPSLADLSTRLWEAARRAIVAYATRADGGRDPRALERGLIAISPPLLANEALPVQI